VKRSEFSKNRLAGGYGDKSGDVTITETKVLGNGEAGLVLTKNTSWKGTETITFADNSGKEIWADAEFEISDTLKEILSEKENPDETDSEEPLEQEGADQTGDESTTENETPSENPETEQKPEQAIIIEEE